MANQPSSPPPGSVPGSFSPGDMDLDSLKDQFSQSQGGGQSNAAGGSQTGKSAGTAPAKPAKAIGQTLPQELKNLGENFGENIKNLLPDSLQQILGMKPTDSPEDKAKKQQLFQNYQKLNAEDQAYVQKKLQQEQSQKQQTEQDEKLKKQRAEEDAANSEIAAPRGKTTGAGADGSSGAKRATNKINDDRKKLSSVG